jgi:leader peptidase (prepilin peptidase)/N-methyltransferase
LNPDLGELQAAWPWLPPAAAAVVGACVGSFVNVVIHRLPADESTVRPRSHCACGAPIAWRDNVPILSWLILRGRARCCDRRISARYPLVEGLTALLFLACWLRYAPAEAACGAVFVSALTAGAFIDAEHMIIPDALTLGLAFIGVLLSFLVPGLHGEHGDSIALDGIRSGGDAIAGLIVGSGLLLWIALPAEALLKKEAMGFGDVKLIGAIGAFCGWRGAVFSVFGGAIVGALGIAVHLLWKNRPGQAKPAGAASPWGLRVPFGPMLSIGAALYFLALRTPVDAWFAQASLLF